MPMSANIPKEKAEPSREQVYHVYIEENLTRKEAYKKLGLKSLYFLNILLKKYGIEKSKELENQARNNMLIRKFGSLEELHRQSREKAEKTKISKYGSLEKASQEQAKAYKDTCREKYGCDNIFQLNSVKEKSKEKKMELYGDPNYCNLDKARKTNLDRYGAANVFQNDAIKEKSRTTCRDRYGTDYACQSAEVKGRIESAIIDKYGSSETMYKQRQPKTQATKKARYGSENYNNEALRRKTCLLRYGNEGYVNPDKYRETCMERYGVCNCFQLDSVKERSKETNMDTYGVPYAVQSDSVKQKTKESLLEKYGVDSYSKTAGFPDEVRNSIISHFGTWDNYVSCTKKKIIVSMVSSGFMVPELQDEPHLAVFLGQHPKETVEKLASYCNSTKAQVFNALRKFGHKDMVNLNPNYSREEEEIRALLDSWKIPYRTNVREVLGNGQEIDIYCPEHKVGIEFNGNYWHSDLCKEKDYHFRKSMLAQEKGIRLIHIYEYEWLDPAMNTKIVMMLRSALGIAPVRIYARKCTIREITNKEAKVLNDRVHLQGHRNAQLTYGLFYHGELVQLMSFSRAKYNRNLKTDRSWEIIRGCPGSNSQVIGGVSKLFSHFVRDNNPDEVFSYCDFNKFNGKSYEALGMEFVGYTGPDKTWLIEGRAVKRSPHHYREYRKSSEAVIWGAGSKKYVWKNGSDGERGDSGKAVRKENEL